MREYLSIGSTRGHLGLIPQGAAKYDLIQNLVPQERRQPLLPCQPVGHGLEAALQVL